MGDALENLLALVDFCDLIVEKLVAALADLDDLGTFRAPSCPLLARGRFL